jgi:hypothetical protein
MNREGEGMKFKFEDIEMAFDFVSSAPPEENAAVVRKDTGQILWQSGLGDADEISEEDWDAEDAVAIPHKNDLALGRRLVSEAQAQKALRQWCKDEWIELED